MTDFLKRLGTDAQVFLETRILESDDFVEERDYTLSQARAVLLDLYNFCQETDNDKGN